MISRPAIDPATSTRPVMNQLIAKVSSVPRVRQLMAFKTDLVWVSAPRNKITPCASSLADLTVSRRTFGAPRYVWAGRSVIHIARNGPHRVGEMKLFD